MRIVLVRLNGGTIRLSPIRYSEHLGLGSLGATLRSHGYDVQMVDCTLRALSVRQMLDIIAHKQPDLIGVTLNWDEETIRTNIDSLRQLKAVFPYARLCVGGWVASLADAELISEVPEIDYVVRGEGELTLLELVEAIDKGSRLKGIKGLTWNDCTKAVREDPRPPVESLGSLPPPARDMYQLSLRLGATPLVETSRGCHGTCSFCTSASFYGKTRWRAKPAEIVVEEMLRLWRLNYTKRPIYVIDDNFIGTDPERARQIAALLHSERTDLRFFFHCRADNVERSLFAELKRAGATMVFVGIESGNPRSLHTLGKNLTVATNVNAIETLKQVGLPFRMGFIMFDPYSTIEDLKDNIDFLYQNNCANPAVTNGLTNRLVVIRGARIRSVLEKGSLLRESGYLDYVIDYQFGDELVALIYSRLQHLKACMSALVDEHVCSLGSDEPVLREQLAYVEESIAFDFLVRIVNQFLSLKRLDECTLQTSERACMAEFRHHLLSFADSGSGKMIPQVPKRGETELRMRRPNRISVRDS